MRKVIFAVMLTAFLVITPIGVSAHDEVHTFNNIDGKNIMLVYYNLEQFQTKLPNTFYIKFYQIIDGRPIDYEVATVKFVKDGRVMNRQVLESTIDQLASYSYDFPEPGLYNMEVELQKDGQNLTSASFPIQVAGRESSTKSSNLVDNLVFLAFGLVIGVSGRYFYSKFRSKKE